MEEQKTLVCHKVTIIDKYFSKIQDACIGVYDNWADAAECIGKCQTKAYIDDAGRYIIDDYYTISAMVRYTSFPFYKTADFIFLKKSGKLLHHGPWGWYVVPRGHKEGDWFTMCNNHGEPYKATKGRTTDFPKLKAKSVRLRKLS